MADRPKSKIFINVNINDENLAPFLFNTIWTRSALVDAHTAKSYATVSSVEAVEFREGESVHDALTRHLGAARIWSVWYQYTTCPGTLAIYRIPKGMKLEDIQGPIQLSCRIRSSVVVTTECQFEDRSQKISRTYRLSVGFQPYRRLEATYSVRSGITQIIGMRLQRTRQWIGPDSSLLDAGIRDGDTVVFYMT